MSRFPSSVAMLRDRPFHHVSHWPLETGRWEPPMCGFAPLDRQGPSDLSRANWGPCSQDPGSKGPSSRPWSPGENSNQLEKPLPLDPPRSHDPPCWQLKGGSLGGPKRFKVTCPHGCPLMPGPKAPCPNPGGPGFPAGLPNFRAIIRGLQSAHGLGPQLIKPPSGLLDLMGHPCCELA